jgi:hypothetical protein
MVGALLESRLANYAISDVAGILGNVTARLFFEHPESEGLSLPLQRAQCSACNAKFRSGCGGPVRPTFQFWNNPE